MPTWLLAITRNVAIDALRMRRPNPVDPAVMAAYDLQDQGSRGAPAAAAELGSEVESLRSALAKLPVEQRRAVVLATLCGRTAREVGETEGVPLGTAKTRIRAGLFRLRASLGVRREAANE